MSNDNIKETEKFYQMKSQEVEENLQTSISEGLSKTEVDKRRQEFGYNKLEETKQKSLWEILLSQIKNPVVYLLVVATIVSFVFNNLAEGIAIIVVILVNTAIGFWMEFQAMKSMDALKKMEKIKAQVIRDGQEQVVDAEELVPGDVLLFEAGDLVSADARIVEAAQLKIDESPLTGESLAVEKDTEPLKAETQVADRINMAYKGTAVTSGSGKAIVTTTGMNTELGSISKMVADAEETIIPLDKKLHKLTKNLIGLSWDLRHFFFYLDGFQGRSFT